MGRVSVDVANILLVPAGWGGGGEKTLSLDLFPFIWGSKVGVSGRVERPAVSAAPQPAGCLLSLRSSPIYHPTRYQEPLLPAMDLRKMERSIYLGLLSDGKATGDNWYRRAAPLKAALVFQGRPELAADFYGAFNENEDDHSTKQH